ncbi:MAG TPA: aldo/keto reductase [Alphaproteobacteria bacterium]|nr:aldo/keto reductase [Alphaproteobacteria bacterium]
MQLREFGPTGRQVVVIGQGTWNMERERGNAVAALRRGIERGMTHIDTAEMYGSGRVEEIVGEAIKGRREGLYLVSKVLPENASRKGTIEACERSLKHLGTDRLDCYLLHWPGRHPLADTIAAFESLREAGKIASWGLSNFDAGELEKALAIAGPGKIACNQVLYHLEERAIEHGVLPWCADHGVALVAYSPFGSGRFPAAGSAGGRVLAAIAEKHRATARQVALAFLTRHPAVFAIPKAAKVEHVAENAAAGRVTLSPAEIAELERAFPRGRKRGLPML